MEAVALSTPRSPRPVLLALALALALGAGCPPPPAEEPDAPPPFRYHEGVRAEDYYPLDVGASWAYNVRFAGRDPVLTILRVLKLGEEEVTFEAGDRTFTYYRKPDGLYKVESGYYILKTPIRPGADWPLTADIGRARIAAVDATVTVPAGTFKSCVVVVEEAEGQRLTTTYAPGVGPVKMEFVAVEADGKTRPVSSGELIGYKAKPEAGPGAGESSTEMIKGK